MSVLAYHDSDHEVSTGQRHYQVVGHILQRSLKVDGGDDERVAHDRADDEQA